MYLVIIGVGVPGSRSLGRATRRLRLGVEKGRDGRWNVSAMADLHRIPAYPNYAEVPLLDFSDNLSIVES